MYIYKDFNGGYMCVLFVRVQNTDDTYFYNLYRCIFVEKPCLDKMPRKYSFPFPKSLDQSSTMIFKNASSTANAWN